MEFTTRHNNGRHSSRPKKDLIFAPPHFEKRKKELPTLNFLSGFLFLPSFSTFASRAFLFVEKITNKSHTPFGKLAKELNPARKTKTPAKKFSTAPASWTVLCISTVLFSVDSFAQQPQTPTPEGFEPVNTGQRYTNSRLTQQNNQQTPTQNYPMGATAQDIINQANSRVQGPVYTPNMTPQERQQANNRYIQQQMANDPAYQTPNSSNGFTNLALQREKEMTSMLNEISQINEKANKSGHYESAEYKNDLMNYQNAFNKLKNMLEGKTPISIADAIYAEESAYGGLHMTYKEYKEEIAKCAAFIKQWMLENSYNSKNPESVHLAIQKFMGDKLTIKNNKPDNLGGISIPNSHNPYMYDYIDYRAEEDLHNYFLTKTLATGTGQCNTLPRVYLVIAEALGVNASLTFAPQHSFIKYQNNNGTIENYEPTIDWHMSDNDYTENMPVLSSAITNKLYLNPLNKKQMVASLIIDLAYNFEREHWLADGKFMNECLDYAMTKVTDSEALLQKNLMLASKLDRILLNNNITDLNDIEKCPEAVQAYKDYRNSSNRIKELGIQQFPESTYNAMLEKHDSRGKLQIAKKIDTKSKKSLFFTLQTQ